MTEEGRGVVFTTDLLDVLPHAVWLADRHGVVTYLNARGRAYVGSTVAAEGAIDWLGELHPEDVEAASVAWEEALAAGGPYEAAFRWRRHDGEYRWHLALAIPMRDPHGDVRGWVGTLTDVHEARTAADELAETARLLRAAEESASLGSWRLLAGSDEILMTPGLAAMFEMEERTAPFSVLIDRLHPDDREQAARTRPGHPWGDPPAVAHYRLVRRDGSERILEVRHHRTAAADGSPLVSGTAQDVTERVLAEREARLWSEVAEHAPLSLTVVTVEETSGRPMLETARTNRHGRAFEPLREAARRLGEDELDELLADFRRAAHERVIVHTGDVVRIHGDLGERILDRMVYPLPEPGMVAITGTDVTERRRLERDRLDLLRRMAAIADQERERIAEHLHDDAVGSLTSALLRIDLDGGSGATGWLEELRSDLEAAARALRLTIVELTDDGPSSDLTTSLTMLGDHLFAGTGTAVDVRAELGDREPIPHELSSATYKIAREALANVRRHAQASSVHLTLHVVGGWLIGEVTDDGVGIGASDPVAGHLGLRLMRERAEALGGRLRVETRETGGTIVRWELALPKEARVGR